MAETRAAMKHLSDSLETLENLQFPHSQDQHHLQ